MCSAVCRSSAIWASVRPDVLVGPVLSVPVMSTRRRPSNPARCDNTSIVRDFRPGTAS